MRTSALLEYMYSPIKWHKKRFPKAAKKKRVMNKWLNRFGQDIDVSTLVYKNNPFLKLLKTDASWGGAYIPIPYEVE